MNINNSGGAGAAAVQARPENIRAKAKTEEPVRTPKAAPAQQASVKKDAYVPAPPNRISSSLYEISDITGNGISQFSSKNQAGSITPSGEKVGRKVVELKLPIGKKSLKIYTKSK